METSNYKSALIILRFFKCREFRKCKKNLEFCLHYLIKINLNLSFWRMLHFVTEVSKDWRVQTVRRSYWKKSNADQLERTVSSGYVSIRVSGWTMINEKSREENVTSFNLSYNSVLGADHRNQPQPLPSLLTTVPD